MLTNNQPIGVVPLRGGGRVNELVRSRYRTYIDLNGEWEFQLDPDRCGEELGLHRGESRLNDTIRVPGCLEAQGKGLIRETPARPEWSTSSDKPYCGAAWYRKAFGTPANAVTGGSRLILKFGGAAMSADVWLNDVYLGAHAYAAVPFEFDVTDCLRMEESNTLIVRVDNALTNTFADLRETMHGFGAMTTELSWSGLYRGVELVAQAADRWIEDLHVVGGADGTVSVRWELGGDRQSGDEEQLRLCIAPWSRDGQPEQPVLETETPVSAAFGVLRAAVGNCRLWSDNEASLYTLSLVLLRNGTPVDDRSVRFGFRDIAFDGKKLLLNGKPVYLRGDMVHFHWPHTVSPTTDRDDLRSRLVRYKEFGFNYLRHHTHFPSPEYLDVCDELGLLCHNELGVLMQSESRGRKGNTAWKIREDHAEAMWELLVRRDRNHPSVIIWCFGNESHPSREDVLRMAERTRAIDDSRLIQSSSPGYFVVGNDLLAAPVFHECRSAGGSYIDVGLKAHYREPLRHWRALFAEARTTEAGLKGNLPRYVRNTQLLQSRCRKIVMESVRLNPGWEGFEWCTFRDSGSFVWGIVDDFFQPKADTAEQIAASAGETVLLWTTDWRERVYRPGDHVPVAFKCSHYGSSPLVGASLRWVLLDDAGHRLAAGERDGIQLHTGELAPVAADEYVVPETDKGRVMRLVVELLSADGERIARNEWELWSFPAARPAAEYGMPVWKSGIDSRDDAVFMEFFPLLRTFQGEGEAAEGLLVTGTVDEVLNGHLASGGRAILLARDVLPGTAAEWGSGRSEYPRGTMLLDGHPLLESIPHDGWADIPFADAISGDADLDGMRNTRGMAVRLGEWPAGLKPIIEGIPSFKDEAPEKLGYLFEVRVGPGRLLVTSLGFASTSPVWPYAMYPGTAYLFEQMLLYACGDRFEPDTSIEPGWLKRFSGRRLKDKAPADWTRIY